MCAWNVKMQKDIKCEEKSSQFIFWKSFHLRWLTKWWCLLAGYISNRSWCNPPIFWLEKGWSRIFSYSRIHVDLLSTSMQVSVSIYSFFFHYCDNVNKQNCSNPLFLYKNNTLLVSFFTFIQHSNKNKRLFLYLHTVVTESLIKILVPRYSVPAMELLKDCWWIAYCSMYNIA